MAKLINRTSPTERDTMIQIVPIKTVEDLMPLLSEQEWRDDLHRNRSSYVYRGMPNTDFKMETTLRRC